MTDKNTILEQLQLEATRLEQTLSELQTSHDKNYNKGAIEEITTLLKDIQQLIHSIKNPLD